MAYLHHGAPISIVHRDLKSANGENTEKQSDESVCQSFIRIITTETTLVKGLRFV